MIRFYLILAALLTSLSITATAQELIIGEEKVKPGIVYIFEGAVKDHITPNHLHLAEKNTHIHIEARVNWDNDTAVIPKGTPAGGFVPYLRITATIVNEATGISTFVDLLPHINLVDNFHYARNITLPGAITDRYHVTFTIIPPALPELALHHDWVKHYGKALTAEQHFSYGNVDFEAIAKASRR